MSNPTESPWLTRPHGGINPYADEVFGEIFVETAHELFGVTDRVALLGRFSYLEQELQEYMESRTSDDVPGSGLRMIYESGGKKLAVIYRLGQLDLIERGEVASLLPSDLYDSLYEPDALYIQSGHGEFPVQTRLMHNVGVTIRERVLEGDHNDLVLKKLLRDFAKFGISPTPPPLDDVLGGREP